MLLLYIKLSILFSLKVTSYLFFTSIIKMFILFINDIIIITISVIII